MKTIYRTSILAATFAVLSAGLTGCPENKTEPEVVAQKAPEVCRSCGTIVSIREIRQKGEGSGAGAFMGAVVGGVAGHQVGGGRGKDAATVAGAVGGAFAGNEIEKRAKATLSYDVALRMEDGSSRTVNTRDLTGLAVGDRVRVSGGALVREG